ncbi:MAG: hypothetical protein ABI792_09460 [bacterium]
MTATKLKNIIVKRISEVEDIKILRSINQILESKEKSGDLYKLSEDQREKIKKSKSQLKEGQRIPNEKVFDDAEKWLKEK